MKALPTNPRTATLVAESLECMRLLDSTVEFAEGCLLWTGATSNTGHPIYKPYGCPCTLVRRAVFAFSGGVLEYRVPIDTTCGERTCINPAHLVKTTRKAIGKKASARGAWSGKARCAKIAKAKRAQAGTKLDMDQARSIRMSSETSRALAQRYGINRTLIQRIKAGRAWKDYTNPFAGLMQP